MIAARSGVIVNNSSIAGLRGMGRLSHYAASKWGLTGLTKSWAIELAPHGIRVVSVAPGAIETPINRDVLDDPEQKREVLEEIPLGRWGTVDDVAKAIAWVASEQAGYVTGTTLFVDGGMTLYPKFV
jgi:glucose 1-dehydrogenase